MDGPQVSWVLLGGISFPAVLTEQKDGKFIATSPDWRIAVHGDSASGALSALSRELDRLIEEAITRRRREDKAGSM